MQFDSYGYPKVMGADDFADSSHLAGILAIVEHPQAIDCRKYVTFGAELTAISYSRYPRQPIYDFSRDQAICLMSGLIKQGHTEYVNLDFITGRDILPPSVRGLVRIARGKKPTLLQRAWLKAEIYWHGYLQPLDEPFQIMCMILTYDSFAKNNELLKLWTSKNKLWRWSVRRYFSQLDGAWRGEPELAEYIIQFIERKVSV